MLRRTLAIVASAVVLGAIAAMPAQAADHRPQFPTTIALPDGWQPEGIATGLKNWAFFGSRLDGDIYRVDLATGRGKVITQGPGTPSLGMKLDHRGRLYVAGGTGGDGRLIDGRSGALLRAWRFTGKPAFVNDVTLTPSGAWFTDSANPQLYRVVRGTVTTVPLTGDIVYTTGTNANGIDTTPDGRGLLVIQSNTGKLFNVTTGGAATEVDLGGESLANGDGILRRGTTLYVMQNRLNRLAVVKLDRAATKGTVVKRVTDRRFDVPTTIASFKNRLYLPNARFGVTPTPTTPYTAVAIPRPRP